MDAVAETLVPLEKCFESLIIRQICKQSETHKSQICVPSTTWGTNVCGGAALAQETTARAPVLLVVICWEPTAKRNVTAPESRHVEQPPLGRPIATPKPSGLWAETWRTLKSAPTGKPSVEDADVAESCSFDRQTRINAPSPDPGRSHFIVALTLCLGRFFRHSTPVDDARHGLWPRAKEEAAVLGGVRWA
ncbi:hypothetical protein B0T16DRAFT_393354 [Cercophora newfieldiana]|uniref:Uncharacterized protein n=1 Tax=Cercophora newfieldiana TaxID=92897 RepID=A0AA39XVR3_9PEZI|nr:hypothetical protein B0T16DRAFT_393354 [Cercophora newfieldiana]